MKPQRGFGLGLHGGRDGFIVFFILSMLGWVAWTSYSDYRVKRDFGIGLKFAEGARVAVEKAFHAKGPADFSKEETTGWSPTWPNDVVRTVVIEKSGTITVLYTERVAPKGSQELQIVPVADGKALDLSLPASKGRRFTWECGGRAGRTTVAERLRRECK